MKGIISTWECPACGGILQSSTIINQKSTGKCEFEGPKKCPACGGTKGFKLITFHPATVYIEKDDDNQKDTASSGAEQAQT